MGVLAGRFVSPALQAVTSMVSGRLVPIYKVETPEQRIAISFDATWGTELTDEILAILDRYGKDDLFPSRLLGRNIPTTSRKSMRQATRSVPTVTPIPT